MKRANRLSWGVGLIFFGVLFLVKQLNVLPVNIAAILYDARNFPIYIGVIFLLFNRERSIGLTLLVIGLLLHLPDFIRLTHQWANFIWPIVAIVTGVVLVFFVRNNKS